MSDDSPEYTAAQKKHSDKVAFEREMMEVMGMTRSQVRGLRTFAQQQAAIQAQRQIAPVVPEVARKVDKSEIKFDPNLFRNQGDSLQGPSEPGGSNNFLEVVVTGVLNGVPAAGTAMFVNTPVAI